MHPPAGSLGASSGSASSGSAGSSAGTGSSGSSAGSGSWQGVAQEMAGVDAQWAALKGGRARAWS
jgi:hypothetical protein